MNSEDYSDKSVAILVPTSTSGEIGGAERFYQGLLAAIRERVGTAEIVSLPSDESTFDAIISTYGQWENLDLSSYDLVISTKAPTYMVKHPRHVLYLVHTVRVFYDMFEQVFPAADKTLKQQRSKIQKLDTHALGKIRHRFSIGHEVSDRLKKWNGLEAEVLHPPLGMNSFKQGQSANYFFMPGRLHSWKRVDLAIRAVKNSKLPLKLFIAGMGEAENELKALAGKDARIKFLGRISDDELVDYYSKALAVIFVPLREDYGYVTLEAFKSGKPVITCTDSGEPLQFVKNGESGLVCNPTPRELCDAMEELFTDKEKAIEMGQRGLRSIEHISWPNVADTLLDAGFENLTHKGDSGKTNRKTRVAILDMQPIDPPVGGGRQRLLGLYHQLGDNIEAKYIGTYDWHGEKHRQHKLTSTLEEIDVPLSEAHHAAAQRLAAEAEGKVVIDIAFARLGHLSPEYLAKARDAVNWADVVIFSHPWVFPLMERHLKPTQLVVYDSHNVEGFLRAQLLDNKNPIEAELLREVVYAEYRAGQRAQLIITCSQDDVDLYARIYEWSREKMKVVPNGVMASKIAPAKPLEKARKKKAIGLSSNRVSAIFIGSDYRPNVEAANFIVKELAANNPDIDFVVAGGVGACISGKPLKNIVITGVIDDDRKLAWLQASDIAINPMFSGSGTNIKMFDFMATGLPVITTAIGARGITQDSTDAIKVVSRGEFSNAIRTLVHDERLAELGGVNRVWVEKDFAWENISASLGKTLIEFIKSREINGRKEDVQIQNNADGTMRLAHISTVGHKCGIGEYTQRLIEHLPKDRVSNLIVTCKTSGSGSVCSSHVSDCDAIEGWYYDNQTWSESAFDSELIEKLRAWDSDAALIQYHSAFYSAPMLKALSDALSARRIRTVVIIHQLRMFDINVFGEMQNAGVTLLAHSRREIELAAKHGVHIEYIPIGVARPVKTNFRTIEGRNFQVHPPVIATTGFLRPHKGIPNLIRAIGIMQDDLPGATLLAKCALYPSDDSRETLESCQEAIRDCGLEGKVTLDTEYLPIEEVIGEISKADIAVLPYSESDEGGSASATTCFTAGLPLVVSRAEIFDELNDIAFQLESTTPAAIAKALRNIFTNSSIYEELSRKSNEYTKGASWDNVTKRLICLLKSEASSDQNAGATGV